MQQRLLFAGLAASSIVVLWPGVLLLVTILSANTVSSSESWTIVPVGLVALAGFGLVIAIFGIFQRRPMDLGTAKNLLTASGLILIGGILSSGFAIGERGQLAAECGLQDPTVFHCYAARGLGNFELAVLASIITPIVTITWILLGIPILRRLARRAPKHQTLAVFSMRTQQAAMTHGLSLTPNQKDSLASSFARDAYLEKGTFESTSNPRGQWCGRRTPQYKCKSLTACGFERF